MRFQDYIVDQTFDAAKDFFKNAKAVPEDKREWSPLDAGRSVLDLCRELAMTPTWAVDTVEGKPQEWSDEAFEKIKEEQSQWKTVEACEEEFNKRVEKMAEVFRATSDEDLEIKRWLPYDGGRDFTVAEMMEYPRWNLSYHLGQIAYIQILLGDREMH